MNKKLLIVIIIIAAAVLGIVIFGQDTDRERSPAERPATGQQEETTVVYTDSGYSPEILRIKSGTKVNFKNQSSGLMWTASAVHPVHTILPEFDARGGTPAGGIYSFIFTKEGSWNYHNHLRPGDGGTIIVE